MKILGKILGNQILGKIFIKELEEDEKDKKYGFLRRLKNIEDKNKEHIKAIQNQPDNSVKAIKVMITMLKIAHPF